MIKRGLVLMVGATGSGKSTSLAAMINYRNESSSDHILTVEDPIEFLHSNKKSIVNQREVGLDTKSFHRALRSAMRAAPDVILIGEIRDRESMEYAITFAGTGHLCLATLHANNAAEALDRIINMFPRDQHTQIFLDLSQYLKAILSQRLVMGRDGKRCAAIEVLLNTPHVQELVKKGDVMGVKEALIRSAEKGMQSFDVALYQLYLRRQGHARGGARQRGFAHQPRGEDQLRLVVPAWGPQPGGLKGSCSHARRDIRVGTGPLCACWARRTAQAASSAVAQGLVSDPLRSVASGKADVRTILNLRRTWRGAARRSSANWSSIAPPARAPRCGREQTPADDVYMK